MIKSTFSIILFAVPLLRPTMIRVASSSYCPFREKIQIGSYRVNRTLFYYGLLNMLFIVITYYFLHKILELPQ